MTKELTILVSAVSGDIGCSAVRSLCEKKYNLIGCDMNPYTPVSGILNGFYKAPSAQDKTGYLRFLNTVIAKENIDCVLPISEPEIKLLSEKRDEILPSGTMLLLNTRHIIETFLDKYRTVQYLSSIGIKTPRTALLSEYDGCFGFPSIVKSRSGSGSKKLWKVGDQTDLDYVRKKDDGQMIVQEYIGSDSEEYTTGVFSDGDKVSTITFRRKLGFGGLSVEAILSDDPFIERLASIIAKAVHLVGCINIQSRRVLEDNTFVPFEINPRLSSTLLFRKKFGFDDLIWWVNILRGKGYSYEKKYRSGRAIRYVSEYYFDMEEWKK
jgi:carbamoyl-phosphate synthase large subunit